MKTIHYAQLALAVVSAGCSAAIPLLVSPMTPVAWLALVGGVALSVKGALAVQSQVATSAAVAAMRASPGKAADRDAARVPTLPLLALALPIAVLCCHESPQAAVAQVVDLTDAVCSLAPDSPVDAPVVEIVCVATEAVETGVSVIVGAISDGGALGAMTVGTIKQDRPAYHFPLPAAAAPAFLAAHRGPYHAPAVTTVTVTPPAPAASTPPAAPAAPSAAPAATDAGAPAAKAARKK
jgi:hypothetical protein